MVKSPIIRIDFCYNGTSFKGYQRQEKARTVQGEIEKALETIYKQSISIYCAGRTDTGVHALHQVASFKTPTKIVLTLKELTKALNALLPNDIRIINTKNEHPSFHARFSPKKRTYLYIINNESAPSPFNYDKVWYYNQKINIKKLRQTLKEFEGEHNFKSFCEKADGTNFIRKLYSIKVKKKKDLIYIYIKGNSFLRKMIRIIVGTSVAIASRNDLSPKIVKTLLALQLRSKNPFPTCPPQGLYFYKVEF